MPTRLLRYDFSLNGKGYILAQGQGRAWHREGTPDTPIRTGARDINQQEFGGVDPEVDYPEVWDDWTGGFGFADRDDEHRNTYHYAINMDARFPHQLVHCQAPLDLGSWNPANSYNWNGVDGFRDLGWDADKLSDATLVIGQYGLEKAYFRGPTMTWAAVASGNLGFRWPAAVYGSYYYVGNWTGTYFTRFNNALTASTIAEMCGFRFAVAGNQLWKVGGPDTDHAFYLQNCGAPNGVCSPANWGATYVIGDQAHPILGIVAFDDQIYATTAKGLYAGDSSGTFVNVLAAVAGQEVYDNCRDVTVFEDLVVTPHGFGIFGYRPSTGQIEEVGPPLADRSPIVGRVTSVVARGRYLYAALYTGSAAHVLAGERQGQRIAWHPLQQVGFAPGQIVSRMHIDGASTSSQSEIPQTFWVGRQQRRGVGGTVTGDYSTVRWQVPSLDRNPLAALPPFSANYIGSARIDFGSVDFRAPGTLKEFRAVEIWSENLASGAQWAWVWYRIDEGARIKLGEVTRSPSETLYFNRTFASDYTGRSIRLSIESFTASAGVTPVYRSVILRGNLHPNYLDVITARVRIADGLHDRQGQPLGRSAKTLLTELRALGSPQGSGGVAVNLVDPTGQSWVVKMLGSPTEDERWMGQGDETWPEIQATIKMAVLTYSGGSGIWHGLEGADWNV